MNRRKFLLNSATAAMAAGIMPGSLWNGEHFFGAEQAESVMKVGDPVNIARYGEAQSWLSPQATPQIQAWMEGRSSEKLLNLAGMPWSGNEFDVGVEWLEHRTIEKITVHFGGEIPKPDQIGFEQWVGLTGLQGNWEPIQQFGTEGRIEDRTWALTFPQIRTCKVRLKIQGQKQTNLETFEIFGPSRWKNGSVRIEWGYLPKEKSYGGRLESYNGEISRVQPFGSARLDGPMSWESEAGHGKIGGITVDVLYSWGIEVDRTILTLRTRTGDFSFLPSEAIEELPIEIPDLGVFIRNEATIIDRATYGRQNSSKSRIMELVPKYPEQTVESAYANIKTNRVVPFVGVAANSQKFAISPVGHIIVGYGDPSFGGIMTPRHAIYMDACGDSVDFRELEKDFQYPFMQTRDKTQELSEGWLPIVSTKWGIKTDLIFERTDFATFASTSSVVDPLQLEGNEAALLISQLRIRNDSPDEKLVHLYLKPWKFQGGVNYRSVPANASSVWETSVQNGMLWIREGETTYAVAYVDTHNFGELSMRAELAAARYATRLKPAQEHTIHLVIAGRPLLAAESSRLKGLTYSTLQNSTAEYWKSRLAKGMQVEVPDARIQNLYRANLHHFLITLTKDSKRGEYYPNTAVFNYGTIGSESSPIIQAFDMRGLHDLAESCLQAFLSTQGDSVPDGQFSSKEGGFYHYWPWYTIDQGFVLWALAEHYLYTCDLDWLRRVAPQIIAGCDFVIRGRKLTQRALPGGQKPIWYGFAPAGTIGDPRSWEYSFMISGYFYLGLKKSAQILRDVDPDNAKRIEAEAEDFRQAIRSGLKESIALSPVTRLRDNTSVPCVPTFVTLRGFITDVKGSADPDPRFAYASDSTVGALHLLKCGVLEPNDPEVGWILNALEDRFFMFSPSERERIQLDDIGLDWFNLGGFDKMQPYYLHYQEAYLLRDQIPNFLRGFFNTLAAIADPQNLTFQEELDQGGGQPQKTHEESWFLQQLRIMLLMEIGDDLFLARGTPRKWLEDGKTIKIGRAPTYFGELAYQISSFTSERRIEATVNPPQRNRPASIYLRLRHPTQAPLRRVMVNDRVWKDFDPAKEWIKLPGNSSESKIIAYY